MLPKHRENTGNFVCSSCRFPDPQGKGYCDICSENNHFFLKLDMSAKSVCVCLSQKPCKLAQGKFVVGQGKNRENRETRQRG